MSENSSEEISESQNEKGSYFPRIFRDWFSESSPSRWVLGFTIEAILIVFSVLLALAVNEWRAENARAQKAQTAIKAIRTELEANKIEAQNAAEYHRDMRDTLQYYEQQDLTPPMNLLMEGIYNPADLYDTAWETAKQSGVVDNIDYELVLDLSSLYQRQDGYAKLSEAIQQDFYVKATIDRSAEELLQDKYKNWAFLLGDFSRREQNLSNYLGDTLKKLDQVIKEY